MRCFLLSWLYPYIWCFGRHFARRICWKEISDTEYIVDPDVNVKDLYDELEIEHLPETSYSSIGGMLYELSDSVPELNQEFKVTAIDDILNEHNDYVQTITTLYFTITKMEDRRITEIKLLVERQSGDDSENKEKLEDDNK